MNFSDRLIRGFIAGIVAGIVMDFFDVVSWLTNIDELNNFQWAGLVIYGSKPNNLLEYGVSVFGQLFLMGVLGIFFVYLIPQVTSKNLIIKGGIFGLFIWFMFFVIPLLFKIKPLMETNAISAASDGVTALIFGITLALTLQWLDKKQKI